MRNILFLVLVGCRLETNTDSVETEIIPTSEHVEACLDYCEYMGLEYYDTYVTSYNGEHIMHCDCLSLDAD